MKACDVGSYQPNQGASQCLAVPVGTYTSISGTTTNYVSCNSGHYCEAGSSVIKACPSGTYGPI
jgi:hypothetical protein